MKQIINSLLDNDLYKLTMLQAFYHYEKNTVGEYSFICRTKNINFENSIDEVTNQLNMLCSLNFTSEELNYLDNLLYFNKEFINFLRNFKLNKKHVKINLDKNNHLKITIKGPIISTSLFEVPLLAIINEVYFSDKIDQITAWNCGSHKLNKKIDSLIKSGKEIKFSDFGTRRRFSFKWHENVIKEIIKTKYPGFLGTSNLYFAKKFNINPIGTMAHEWIMAHAGITSLPESTNLALKRWIEFYEGKLGIALTDTYTTDYFLTEFKKELATKYFGLRHDSGDWKEWGNKIINVYKNLNINPQNKALVFSDGLDFDTINKIYDEFYGKIKLIFGIGTNLTNDVGLAPLQIVIKMIRCNTKPVIKISDSPEKTICQDKQYQLKIIRSLKKYEKGA